jgi:hypothetical protein
LLIKIAIGANVSSFCLRPASAMVKSKDGVGFFTRSSVRTDGASSAIQVTIFVRAGCQYLRAACASAAFRALPLDQERGITLDLVLFDLDNLCSTATATEWAQFLIEQGVLERKSAERRNQVFLNSTRPAGSFLRLPRLPARAAGAYPRAQLDAWHARFMAQKITAHQPASRRLVTHNLREGICAPSSRPPTPLSPRRSRASLV